MSENMITQAPGQLLTDLAGSPRTADKLDAWTDKGSHGLLTGEEVAALASAGMPAALAELARMSEVEAAAAPAADMPGPADTVPTETIEVFRAAAWIAELSSDEEAGC
ncbi:hypothetical protein ACIF8W_28640 [Streptomyces sp. NPDC085639]|uniref:hypothetical protein n=1 Tax=Streptomyces sp. NPDC085639 TaxID=3365734 RepID=UPI0037D6BC05